MILERASHAEWIDIGIIIQKVPVPHTADLFGKAEQLLDSGGITLYRNRPHLCKLMQDCHQWSNQKELSLGGSAWPDPAG